MWAYETKSVQQILYPKVLLLTLQVITLVILSNLTPFPECVRYYFIPTKFLIKALFFALILLLKKSNTYDFPSL